MTKRQLERELKSAIKDFDTMSHLHVNQSRRIIKACDRYTQLVERGRIDQADDFAAAALIRLGVPCLDLMAAMGTPHRIRRR